MEKNLIPPGTIILSSPADYYELAAHYIEECGANVSCESLTKFLVTNQIDINEAQSSKLFLVSLSLCMPNK